MYHYINAVTWLTWVRRGVAKARPELVRLRDDELENLLSSAGEGQHKPTAIAISLVASDSFTYHVL